MDNWYTIAKMRQQEKIMEAEIWRLLKAAKATPSSGSPGLRSRLLALLGVIMLPSNIKLHMESK